MLVTHAGKDHQAEMVKANKGSVWLVNVIFSSFTPPRSYELASLAKSSPNTYPRGTNKMGEGAKNLLNMLQPCSQYTLIFIYVFIFVF